MLAVFRVLLNSSTCPCEAATACRANCILRENLRQGVRELVAKCRNVVAGAHGHPQTCDTSMLPFQPIREGGHVSEKFCKFSPAVLSCRVIEYTYSPSVGIAQLLIWVQTHPVEYRGIRYTIRSRIEREQWSVAIYPAGVEMAAKVITGPRRNAELLARSMINNWLKRHSTQQHQGHQNSN
jgi:hypothetical protein